MDDSMHKQLLEGRITQAQYQNNLVQQKGFKNYKEYRNYLSYKNGFKNRSDVALKIKQIVRSMIQLHQNYEGCARNKFEIIKQLYEIHKNTQLICSCCPTDSESQQHSEFMTIDHINNDGAEHRNSPGVKSSITNYLFSHGFNFKDYQLMCYNCNSAIGHFGYCPHHPEVKREIKRR